MKMILALSGSSLIGLVAVVAIAVLGGLTALLVKASKSEATDVTPSEPISTGHVNAVVADYLRSRGWRRISFDRIRTNINTSFDDDLLLRTADDFAGTFRVVKIKYGKRGLRLRSS